MTNPKIVPLIASIVHEGCVEERVGGGVNDSIAERGRVVQLIEIDCILNSSKRIVDTLPPLHAQLQDLYKWGFNVGCAVYVYGKWIRGRNIEDIAI